MMMTRRRSSIAAFTACFILLAFTAPVYPSYNSDAGHAYAVASQRQADLQKSSKKKKYRSYWIDCIRSFEMVEKRYPKSSIAADACFDRAFLYFELYQISRYSRDLDVSMRVYRKCQSSHPTHDKAPEALYRVIDLSLQFNRNHQSGASAYAKLSSSYPNSPWLTKARARLGVTPKAPVKPVRQAKTKPAKPRSAVVKNVRFWSEGDYTRVVIDESHPVDFQAYELKQPDRLVFDLLNSRVGNSITEEPLLINNGILKQVRVGQYSPDTVRVVLDLASIKSYIALPLRDPDNPRLVIDVTGEGASTAPHGGEAVSEETETGGTRTAETGSTAPPAVATVQTPSVATAGSNTDGERLTLSRQLGMKVKTIAIDAGHGGHDPGAIGKSGLKEKNITLDIAKRLSTLVKDRLGCTVVMTRDKDVFITLDERPFIAKSRNADLFVSIHVNANRKRKTRGIETYVQGLKASDREAMATAARENAMSQRSLSQLDNEVERMLKDLKTDNKIEESIQLAGIVQTSLIETVKPIQKTVINHGVKSAFFYVLMNTNIPSILAEVGFISNPDEERLLKKESYRQSIAEALFQGVKKYVDDRSPQMIGI